jgi:chemotaxis protein MotB
MSYDRRLGLVRIRTDLTFPSGSAELRPGVQAALAELARILASREAAKYEVQVVGHTDNVPISNPQTRRNHPTNWHLSVHRAISVKDALADAGVAPVRMAVAGYGRFRPVVPNGPDGAEENRRVDVFLTSPTYPLPETPPAAGQAGGETGDAPARTAPDQPRPEPPGAFK